MKRVLLLASLLTLAACSGKDAEAPLGATPPRTPAPTAPPAPEKPAPAPAPTGPGKPPAAGAPEAGPLPDATAEPRPAEIPPARKSPARPYPIAALHLPAFTLRTVDRSAARVEINGEELSTTPCLWSITSTIVFDEKLDLGQAFPPEGARYVGVTTHPDDPKSTCEVYVVDRPDRLARFPSLRKDECLLLVRGKLQGTPIQGGLRLRVEGCRFTVFTPLVDPEGEEASRLVRTLWFERTPHE